MSAEILCLYIVYMFSFKSLNVSTCSKLLSANCNMGASPCQFLWCFFSLEVGSQFLCSYYYGYMLDIRYFVGTLTFIMLP